MKTYKWRGTVTIVVEGIVHATDEDLAIDLAEDSCEKDKWLDYICPYIKPIVDIDELGAVYEGERSY